MSQNVSQDDLMNGLDFILHCAKRFANKLSLKDTEQTTSPEIIPIYSKVGNAKRLRISAGIKGESKDF